MTERRFVLHNDFVRRNVMAFLGKASIEKPLEVIVRPFIEKRSIAANARMWALHQLAAEHTGYSADEMHEHALCRFFGYEERQLTDPLTGEIVTRRIPKERSSGQNRKRFGEFMESTESWYISEFGLYLEQRAA